VVDFVGTRTFLNKLTCIRNVAVHLSYGTVRVQDCIDDRGHHFQHFCKCTATFRKQICRKCLLIELNGLRLYRRSWTPLPTTFVSAQRLSERTILANPMEQIPSISTQKFAFFKNRMFIPVIATSSHLPLIIKQVSKVHIVSSYLFIIHSNIILHCLPLFPK
jgi:hypothetical protein